LGNDGVATTSGEQMEWFHIQMEKHRSVANRFDREWKWRMKNRLDAITSTQLQRFAFSQNFMVW